jgi:hypothetical protein
MRTSHFVWLFAGALVGCGGGGSSTPPPVERPTVNVRFVHLFASASGTPGGKVDVYRRYGKNNEEAMPVVTGLGYGEVSAFVHPYEVDIGSGLFSFYNSGTHTKAAPYEGFTITETMADSSRWTIHIESATSGSGTGFIPGWNTRQEAPVASGAYPPAANPNKARVMINDIGIQVFPNAGLYAGSGGMCLKYAGSPRSEPDLVVTDQTVFDFDPGTFSLGLYPNPSSGPGDCTVTADFGPASITGAAGSRTWLYLYGPTATDRRTLVLPFGE